MYLKENTTNFTTARELYLNENALSKNRFITQISQLEKEIEQINKEKNKTNQKNNRTIAHLTSENAVLNQSLKENLGLISPPKGAIIPDQYSDFIYTISISLSDKSNSPKFGSKEFKYGGIYAQILSDGAYHVIGHPRSKIRPPIFWIFSGLDSKALTPKIKAKITKYKHKIDPKLIHELIFSIKPYLLTGDSMLLQDPKINKFAIYPINDIIPKSEFKSKRHKLL